MHTSGLRKGLASFGALVILLTASTVHAQDKSKDEATDKAIYESLREVINRGADLYNVPVGDHKGCYHIYEGALIAIKPLLNDELKKAVDDAMTEASQAAVMHQRAFALRRAIDKIRDATKPGGTTPPTVTLWENLGGETNVRKVVDDFVAATSTNPKVDFFRGGKYKLDAKGVADLKQSLVNMISQYTGGPFKYTGPSMKKVHEGMGITAEQFGAMAKDLEDALKKNGAKDADIAAVMKVIGLTEKDIVEPGEKPTPPTAKKLWERLGGEAGVTKVVDDFVAAAAVDPAVNFDRGGKYKLDDASVAKLKTSLVSMISAVSGGPLKYEGKDMKEVHEGMKITEAEFNRTAFHLDAALKKNGVPKADADELMKIVGTTKDAIVEVEKEPEDKKPVPPPEVEKKPVPPPE